MSPVALALTNDGFLRKTAQVLVITAALFLAVVPVYILLVAFFGFSSPDFINDILDNNLSGELVRRADIATLLVGVFPVMVATVCYVRDPGARSLNKVGKAVCIIAILGLILSVVALQHLKGGIESQIEPAGVLGNRGIYLNLTQFVGVSVSVYMFYLATFLGFSQRPDS